MPPELRAFDSVPFERFAVFAACPSVSFIVFPPVFHGGFPLVFLLFRIHTLETPAKTGLNSVEDNAMTTERTAEHPEDHDTWFRAMIDGKRRT